MLSFRARVRKNIFTTNFQLANDLNVKKKETVNRDIELTVGAEEPQRERTKNETVNKHIELTVGAEEPQ